MESSYWRQKTFSRRQALRAAAVTSGGIAALSLVGCDGDSDDSPSGSGASDNAGVIDSTKGIRGGTLRVQSASASPNLTVLGSGAGGHFRQLAYSGLLQFDWGQQGLPGDFLKLKADAAQALPEQPDQNTFVYKLRPGVKFHNGRVATSEDVAYSYVRNATWDQAPRRPFWTWLDKVETPDPQTVVVKSKAPYSEALFSMAAHSDAFIMAKEFEEGPEASTKAMGTGPYLFVDYQAPIVMRFRRNPDYFDQPYPYFDQVESYVAADAARRVTDFTTRQVDVAWWYSEDGRDQVNRERQDTKSWAYPGAAFAIWIRLDQKPLDDKRVRQALAVTLDRQTIRGGVSKGEGEDDQVLSWINKTYGFRKPSELGAAAKYWKYDPAEAKKLLSAAGVDKPIETNWSHFDAATDGQASVDQAVLAQARWSELGIAKIKDVPQLASVFNSTVAQGNYEGFAHRPGLQGTTVGTNLKTKFYWPEGGARPSTNVSWLNSPQMNTLLDRQLTQFNMDDRKKTFAEIENIVAEEQYQIAFSTYANVWFADESIQNISMPFFAVSGQSHHWKYWWFDKK